MAVYKIKSKTRSWDGETIGILILDAAYPCVPGNVGNATTYPFPVRYKEIRGSSIERLLNERDPELLKPFIEGARELEAESVQIPVFLSSLLQVPFICRTLTSKQKVGIISANASVLTEEHFQNVGITKDMPIVLYGMEDQYEFRTSVLEEKGTMDSDLVEKEVVGVAERMVREHPEVAAIVLECSDLPPYAAAVHEATGRPVFDFITMIKYVHSALVPRRYEGYM